MLDTEMPHVIKAVTGAPHPVRRISGGHDFNCAVAHAWPHGYDRFFDLVRDYDAYRFGHGRRSRAPYRDTALVGRRYVDTKETPDFDTFMRAMNDSLDGSCYAVQLPTTRPAWRSVLFYPREIVA